MKKANENVATVIKNAKLKNAEEVKAFLVGRTVKVTSTTDSNNYGPIGNEHVIGEDVHIALDSYGMPHSISFVKTDGYVGNNIKLTYLEFSAATVETLTADLKRLAKQEENLAAEKAMIEYKLKFMEETKAETFSYPEFIQYRLKALLGSKTNTDAKAKEIMALFK